jgi:hypothetical protein
MPSPISFFLAVAGDDANEFQVGRNASPQGLGATASVTGAGTGKRAPLSDISPFNHKRTNGYISAVANGNPITPNNATHSPSKYPHSIQRRAYQPSYRDENLVYSSVDWKWKTNQGKELDKGLFYAIKVEM